MGARRLLAKVRYPHASARVRDAVWELMLDPACASGPSSEFLLALLGP